MINALAPHMPMLIGGSADLGVSNNTDIKDGGDFEAGSYDGRIIHFGVREHAMGATMTGMALNGGLIPLRRHVHDVFRLHAAVDSARMSV